MKDVIWILALVAFAFLLVAIKPAIGAVPAVGTTTQQVTA